MWFRHPLLRLHSLISQPRSHWKRSTRLRFSVNRSMHKASEVNIGIESHEHPFYNYTSGRWIYNENLRLAERHLRFDANELCKIVAKSVGQRADDIKVFTKVAEGGSYRVFEAIFSDQLKVIARLPYPCSLPRKYGTASEVATMDFLRIHGIPTPRVYDWSDSSSNSVGSEYIIMERVAGAELEESWYTMTVKERMAIIEKIVDIERTLFNINFPASGSLFFKESLGNNMAQVGIATPAEEPAAPKFCIGPSTEYLWWYQNRNELNVHSGPWKSSEDVLKAVGDRELAWLTKFGKHRYPREPLYRDFYGGRMVDPQMRNLSDYLKIAPLIAPNDLALNKPCIRHPDLSPSNIFVSNSGEITGIIDWQHCAVLPIFLQAKIPTHFQNYGDEDSESFIPPKLPEDFESLSGAEKDIAAELYRRRQVHYFYLGYTSHNNPSHFHAMGTHDLVMRNRLYDAAGRPWEGDNTSLKAELVQFSRLWNTTISKSPKSPDQTPFPLEYSESEEEECLAINEKQKAADANMQTIRDFIGINIEGWLPNGLYAEAVAKEEEIRKQMLDAAETENDRNDIESNWPFQDHEELD